MRPRLAIDLHTVIVEIHDPVLGDTVFGVERGFHFAVILERVVGDLDDQKYFCRVWLASRFLEYDIGLWFAVSQADRVLNADDYIVGSRSDEDTCQPIHAGNVRITDGHFRNNLPTNEFDAVVLLE